MGGKLGAHPRDAVRAAGAETPAPAWANASAIERPIPRLAPATTTRRPLKSNAIAVPFVQDWRRAPWGVKRRKPMPAGVVVTI
jgi:hypothetical protein